MSAKKAPPRVQLEKAFLSFTLHVNGCNFSYHLDDHDDNIAMDNKFHGMSFLKNFSCKVGAFYILYTHP
jgi:hypothetical protein